MAEARVATAARVEVLRRALAEAVSPEDLRSVAAILVREAKGGSVQAARTLLDRVLGPPEAADLSARLERLESLLGARDDGRRIA